MRISFGYPTKSDLDETRKLKKCVLGTDSVFYNVLPENDVHSEPTALLAVSGNSKVRRLRRYGPPFLLIYTDTIGHEWWAWEHGAKDR